jgi:hypothetical protein
MTKTQIDEGQLLAGFLDGSFPGDQFHHEQHVHVAFVMVRRHGMPRAIDEFATALKAFAAAKGMPKLYHETITWAYLLLISERLARTPIERWEEFAVANGDLLTWKPSVLDRYYAPETLWSDLARTTFVMPDRS